LARYDLGGDHPPGDRLAAPQLPEAGRGPDDDAEPAAADIPSVGADVDSGELIAVGSDRGALPGLLLVGSYLPAHRAASGTRGTARRRPAGLPEREGTAFTAPGTSDMRGLASEFGCHRGGAFYLKRGALLGGDGVRPRPQGALTVRTDSHQRRHP
jgi:hypothetical protein